MQTPGGLPGSSPYSVIYYLGNFRLGSNVPKDLRFLVYKMGKVTASTLHGYFNTQMEHCIKRARYRAWATVPMKVHGHHHCWVERCGLGVSTQRREGTVRSLGH
jgi:hypothetical protein